MALTSPDGSAPVVYWFTVCLGEAVLLVFTDLFGLLRLMGECRRYAPRFLWLALSRCVFFNPRGGCPLSILGGNALLGSQWRLRGCGF